MAEGTRPAAHLARDLEAPQSSSDDSRFIAAQIFLVDFALLGDLASMLMTAKTERDDSQPHSIATKSIATNRPWSPTGIALTALLISPLAAAVLHGVNFKRLSRPELWRGRLYANLVTAVFFVTCSAVMENGVVLSMGLFIGPYYFHSQSTLYDRHLADGGAKAKLWPIVLLVVVAQNLLAYSFPPLAVFF